VIAGLLPLMYFSEIVKTTPDLTQSSELTTKEKPSKKTGNSVINVGYTTLLIGRHMFRIIYDKNQTSCNRLRSIYISSRFRAVSNVVVNVNGQQYVGLKFSTASLTNNYILRRPGRNPSFQFTQYNMRDGI